MRFKCIIVEDEIPAQTILKKYISKIESLELIGSFQTALAANEFLKNNVINVMFLDINLPDISGMDFIRTLHQSPMIIMTTAYASYAAESYEETAIKDYLVKPFSFERFLKAINKIGTTTNNEIETITENHIFLNVDKTQHRINYNEILYIESDRNYVTLVTKKGKLTYIASLKEWLDKLPKNVFLQVHKSYIINCNEINKLLSNTVFLENEKIPIGRVYKRKLLEQLSLK